MCPLLQVLLTKCILSRTSTLSSTHLHSFPDVSSACLLPWAKTKDSKDASVQISKKVPTWAAAGWEGQGLWAPCCRPPAPAGPSAGTRALKACPLNTAALAWIPRHPALGGPFILCSHLSKPTHTSSKAPLKCNFLWQVCLAWQGPLWTPGLSPSCFYLSQATGHSLL